MPVHHKLARSLPDAYSGLKSRLVAEWRDQANEDPRPVIIQEENSAGGAVHLFVIWDAWGSMAQRDRSEIIMDAYEEVAGMPMAVQVTLAMGLTTEEAQRMGIAPG